MPENGVWQEEPISRIRTLARLRSTRVKIVAAATASTSTIVNVVQGKNRRSTGRRKALRPPPDWVRSWRRPGRLPGSPGHSWCCRCPAHPGLSTNTVASGAPPRSRWRRHAVGCRCPALLHHHDLRGRCRSPWHRRRPLQAGDIGGRRHRPGDPGLHPPCTGRAVSTARSPTALQTSTGMKVGTGLSRSRRYPRAPGVAARADEDRLESGRRPAADPLFAGQPNC